MVLQRYIFQATKQCVSRHYLLQTKLKQSYCKLHHRYSSNSSRKYSDRHEWVDVDKDIGTVGITNYAQESLGEVVFVELPDPGTDIEADGECGSLESNKTVSSLHSPISGRITEKNSDLEKKPTLINTSCYERGWLFKVKISKPEELNELMSEKQYEMYLKTEVEKDHT